MAEQYPTLKATDSYRDLQSQLEGTENRIAVARKRYIEAVGSVQRAGAELPDQHWCEHARSRGAAHVPSRRRLGQSAGNKALKRAVK